MDDSESKGRMNNYELRIDASRASASPNIPLNLPQGGDL
jgi:hypothetical protein